jgi:hypothetical protein
MIPTHNGGGQTSMGPRIDVRCGERVLLIPWACGCSEQC